MLAHFGLLGSAVSGVARPVRTSRRAEETTARANYKTALKLIGIMSTLVARAHHLRRHGKIAALEPPAASSAILGTFCICSTAGAAATATKPGPMDLILILPRRFRFQLSRSRPS